MTTRSIAPISTLALALLALLILNSASAQPPTGPRFTSPEINPDKTVVFRFLAPAAKEVKVSAQFEKESRAMTKDSIGIWSVTLGPVKPDIYPYCFLVDGVQAMDPNNVYYFPNERFKNSLVDIPADTPLIHSMQAVPHGTVTYEYYDAKTLGITGSLLVYTPPGYDANPTEKYPVLYLISGTTDTEETWFKVGHANLIMDNLIAAGKARPMIIVMPYGNAEAATAMRTGGPKPADPGDREGAEAIRRAKAFGKDLLNDIIPYVENNYRVIRDKNARAIAGFSRGGGETLRAGFANLDKFSWICCYSAYLAKEEFERDYKNIYTDPDRTNKQLKLFWISVGNEDFLYKQTVAFMDDLKSKNVNFKSLVTTGGHTWMNTKNYLTQTAQLLFK